MSGDEANDGDTGEHDRIVADTVRWLERAVIGLELCPFAKPAHRLGRIRYVVSEARDPDTLAGDLADALAELARTPPEEVETTLLIHPHVLGDFLEYNEFLDVADATVAAMGLEGTLQVAHFHPGFRFEGTAPDDVTNATNRSPYPTLHLLREASVERALASYPEDPEAIYERNIETLRKLGHDGWRALFADGDG